MAHRSSGLRSAIGALAAAAALGGGTAPALAQSGDDRAVLTIVPYQTTVWTRNFNPFTEANRLPTTREFIYEPLVVFNTLHPGRIHHRLADGVSYSDDLRAVTFTLREGVRWSDGEVFDAEDIVFTFDLIREQPALDIRSIWQSLDAVDKIDSHTVTFRLNTVDTTLAERIVEIPIVPEHIWAAIEDPVTYTNDTPVGTGPFTEIERFTSQVYVQCRNPNYWDAATLQIDCLRLPQLANNDQTLIAAQRGELDWFGSFLPDIERSYVAADPEHHRYWFPPGSFVVMHLNAEAEPAGNREAFNDVAFRRAFSMAMDRQAMVDIAGYGYPTVNEYPSGLGRQFDSWNNPAVDEAFGRYTRFDLDGAAAILAEAGYADSDGDTLLETPDGREIAFSILVPNGWTDWVNTVQMAVEGLQALGIDATVATPEAAVWSQRLIDGDYDVAINAYFSGATPHRTFDSALHSRFVGVTRFAAHRFTDPDLDAALDAFTRTADLDRRREAMDRAQWIVAETMPHVPLFNNPVWYQYNTARFGGWFNADNPVAAPRVHAGTPERLIHVLALHPNGRR